MQERRDPERCGERPDEQAGVDPERSPDRRAPPVREPVLEHERHVRPRHDDDDGDDAGEGEDVFHAANRTPGPGGRTASALLVGSFSYGQVTFGFQCANRPAGLYCQIQACSV